MFKIWTARCLVWLSAFVLLLMIDSDHSKAQDRDILEFHGVRPGVTQLSELKQNSFWISQATRSTNPDGTRNLRYLIQPWKSINIIAKDQTVLAVDLFPAKAYSVEDIARTFALGNLQRRSRLPQNADFAAPKLDNVWLESQSVYVLLEVENVDSQDTVKRLRFFGNLPSETLNSVKKPSLGKLSPGKPSSGNRVPPPAPIPSSPTKSSTKTKVGKDKTGSRDRQSSSGAKSKSPVAEPKSNDTSDPRTLLNAYQRAALEFRGIIPRKTRKEDLASLPSWQQPRKILDPNSLSLFEHFEVLPSAEESAYHERMLRNAALNRANALSPAEKRNWELQRRVASFHDFEIWEYELPPWRKIVLLMHKDIVWAIDAFPPKGATVQQIEQTFELRNRLTNELSRPADSDYLKAHYPPLRSRLGTLPETEIAADSPGSESLQLTSDVSPYYRPEGLRVGPILLPTSVTYHEYQNNRIGLFVKRTLDDSVAVDQREVIALRFFGDTPLRYPMFGLVCRTVPAEKQLPDLGTRSQITEILRVDPMGSQNGFQPKDLILEVNGLPVGDINEFRAATLGCPLNRLSEVKVWRSGSAVSLKATPSRPALSNAFHQRASFYFDNRLYDKCLEDFEMASTLDPNNATYAFFKGRCRQRMRDLRGASADYRAAIRIDPKYTAAYIELGTVQFQMGNLDLAIHDFSQAIEVDPDSAEAWLRRGQTYRVTKDWSRAVADFGHLITAQPDSYLGYLERGITYFQMQEKEKAHADFQEAAKRNPYSEQAIKSLAVAWIDSGEHKLAMDMLDQVIKDKPRFAKAYFYRGIIYSRQNRTEDAIKAFDRSTSLDPNDFLTFYNRAILYRQTGRNKTAILDYDRAIDLNPRYRNAYLGRAAAHEKLGNAKQAQADRERAEELKSQ